METNLLSIRTTYFLTLSMYDEVFVRANISELRIILIEHNKRYYQTSDPIISDTEYDQLFALLVDRESCFSDLVTPDSPTQRLVGQKIEGFTSAQHLAEMSSLQNTYSPDEIAKRDEGLRRIKEKQAIGNRTFIIEPKLDGMSVELVFEFGRFTRAVTRGDGLMGEDVTEHAKQLGNLPSFIPGLSPISLIAFRGEIVIPKDAFSRLDGVMTTGGGAFANARNATAGTLRQLDTSLVKKRGLQVFVYDILYSDYQLTCTSATEQYALFYKWGLPFLDRLRMYESIEAVMTWCSAESTKQLVEQQCIDLDGLVIKIQEFPIRTIFGSTHHHPKWAIAYKFPAEQVITILENVSFQVGRTGILTPVAHLSPVVASGVTISRASLHNRAFIQERDLYIGDQVIIQRSGEVIPYIIAGLPERRDGTQKRIEQPIYCPVCSHPVYLDDRALALRCGNTSCDAQIKQRLEHAVSKSCLDISGFGPSLIDSFVDAGLLCTLADIFILLTPEKKQLLRGLPGVAEKKIALIEKEITQKNPYPFRRILNALGIRHIGEVSSRDLAAAYAKYADHDKRSMFHFIEFCLQEHTLVTIHGFGKEMISSLHIFLQDEVNKKVLYRLEEYKSIDRGTTSQQETSSLLKNIRLVVTGSFSWSREELIDYLRNHGAIIQSAVSSQTQYLLAGSGGGSKRIEAEKLGIPVVGVIDFFDKFDLPDMTSGGNEKKSRMSLLHQSTFF